MAKAVRLVRRVQVVWNGNIIIKATLNLIQQNILWTALASFL